MIAVRLGGGSITVGTRHFPANEFTNGFSGHDTFIRNEDKDVGSAPTSHHVQFGSILGGSTRSQRIRGKTLVRNETSLLISAELEF